MTDMTPEQAKFEALVNSSPDKFDLSLTHHHLSGEADLYYLNRDTNIAFLAFRAALSANGGGVTENGMGGHYDSRFGFIRNDGAGVLYATCPECGSVSGQCEEGCPENGSPSVAAPEGFLVKRSPDYIRIIRTKDMGCAAYSKTSDLATEILAWHFLDALLSAAPQPQGGGE